MATLLPNGKQSFENSAGAPLVGGRLYTYDAGTNTPRATYQDAAGTVPNTNPVILDARGEATIFWSGAYKVVLRDAADVTLWTVDNVVDGSQLPNSLDAALRADLAASNSSTKGAGMSGFSRSIVYPENTVGQIIRDTARRSLFEFMSVAQKADVRAGTLLVDCTAAVQAAFDSGEPLDGVAGSIRLDGAILTNVVPNFIGRGVATKFYVYASSGNALELLNNAPGSFDDGMILRDFQVIGTGTGSATGVRIEGAVWVNSEISNVHVKTMGGAGFDFDDCLTLTGRNIKAQGNGGVGIFVRQSNGIVLINPSAESNNSHGIYILEDGAPLGENTGFTLVAPHCEANEGHAVYIRQRQYGTILSGWLQVKGTSGSTRGAIYVENSNYIEALGPLLTTGGDITNLAGVYADGALLSDFLVHCGGFAANRDIVANTGSGRNRFSGTGGGSQGALARTDTSSTGNTYVHWAGVGGNYGPVQEAAYHTFTVAGNEKVALDANGLRLLNHTNSTSATAGGATALPATPQGYVTVNINGVARKIPYYQ